MAGDESEERSKGQTLKRFQCTISKKVNFVLKPAERTMLSMGSNPSHSLRARTDFFLQMR